MKTCDPILGRVIDEVGAYGIEFRDPNFETLVKAIIYQQLSGKVASIIFGRLLAAAGNGRRMKRGGVAGGSEPAAGDGVVKLVAAGGSEPAAGDSVVKLVGEGGGSAPAAGDGIVMLEAAGGSAPAAGDGVVMLVGEAGGPAPSPGAGSLKPKRGRDAAGSPALAAADGPVAAAGNGGAAGSGVFAVCDSGLTPEGVLKLRIQRMRAIGLSQQKITYIRELARAARSGALDLPGLAELPDDEVYCRLTSLKGIGVWTVQMFLIFALRRHDVLPAGDLGIRAAVRKLYGFEQMPTPAQVEELALKWRPYCTVASWYLWRSLEPNASL